MCAHFPVALLPNQTLGSTGGAMSKLWAVELMRLHFLWICVLRLDFPVSEDLMSTKETLSVVRVFTASPSAFPPGIPPPASNWSWAQAISSPRALATPSSPSSPPSLPGFCLWLNLLETNTSIAWLAETDSMDSKIEGKLAGRSD